MRNHTHIYAKTFFQIALSLLISGSAFALWQLMGRMDGFFAQFPLTSRLFPIVMLVLVVAFGMAGLVMLAITIWDFIDTKQTEHIVRELPKRP